MKLFALILFIVMYVLMIAVQKYRVPVVLLAAITYLLSGIVTFGELPETINWNVLLMIGGTMIVVFFFIASRMPDKIAELLLSRSRNVALVTVYLSVFAGVVSAFIDNVATVLMVAPVAISVCKKLKISPVAMLISISVSSNLQGAATLVGDTTSILLGAYAGMDFLDFFFMNGRPGMFFAVELGAIATIPVMLYIFRKDKDPVEGSGNTEVTSIVPTVFLVSIVLLLIAASFIPDKPSFTNGMICMMVAIATLVWDRVRVGHFRNTRAALVDLDLETILMLLGLFVAIQGIVNAGIVDDFAGIIVRVGGSNMFLLYTIVVWGSVVISAFVDNIPYVATMLPVLSGVTTMLGVEPYLLYFGLLCGATLGGNLTPIGASANITAVGLLRKEGYEVKFRDFFRIGGTFTLVAVLCGYLFIWAFWH